MSEIEQAFSQAISQHQTGNLQEAERLYRQVLQAQPQNPDANHNLGVLFMQVGRPQAALPHLKTALDANPAHHQYWLSYAGGLLASGHVHDASLLIGEAKRRGLQGAQIDALQQRAATGMTTGPSQSEMSNLLALCTANRHDEAEATARQMTQRWPQHGFSWKVLGSILAIRSRFDEALPAFRQALALSPSDPEIHNNLGNALRDAGQPAEAEASYRRALELNPDHHQAHSNLGNALRDAGRLAEAEASYRRAMDLRPDYHEAHSNLGVALYDLGRLSEAEACYRHALQLSPDYHQAYNNLGIVMYELGRLAEAETYYRRALQLKPDYHEAHSNLGNTLRDLDRLPEAAASYRRALELKPDYHQAHSNLGATLQDLGSLPEAEESHRRALQLKPDYYEAHTNLGNVMRGLARFAEAEAIYRRALQIKPDYHVAHNNLGNTLHDLGRISEAEQSYRRTLELKPRYHQAHCNLGNALRDLGLFAEAEASYRHALTLVSGFQLAHTNLLFSLNYDPDQPAEKIYAEYRRFDEKFGVPLRTQWRAHENDRRPSRRLRVGYVSPDFRRHSCGYFIEPMLAHHNRKAVEVFAYAEVPVEDEVTARMKSHVDHWVSTISMSDVEMADRVRADGIDILVDLAGHTRNSRLLAFARKPAPVSVTTLGTGYTTGLSAIDWLMTHSIMVPDGSEHLFSEKPWGMSQYAVYRPAQGMGPVGPSPASKLGHVTFGTLSRAVRINHHVIRVWSELLRRVPGSVLLMDSRDFNDPGLRQSLADRFAQHGIGAERLQMGYHTPPWDVLRQVDIGLDCFPHNSGTTLFESLYMGVPYITLAARPSVGRLGASILISTNQPQWIATSEDEYVAKAVALASDLPQLAKIRARLRAEMKASPSMDGPGYVRAVEAAYRGMWHRWCAEKPATTS